MFDAIFNSFLVYYGLDWAALSFGMCGCYLVTNRNRFGFLFSMTGCICGFCVAIISNQYGFIVYNIILICLQSRGFVLWGRAERQQSIQAAE